MPFPDHNYFSSVGTGSRSTSALGTSRGRPRKDNVTHKPECLIIHTSTAAASSVTTPSSTPRQNSTSEAVQDLRPPLSIEASVTTPASTPLRDSTSEAVQNPDLSPPLSTAAFVVTTSASTPLQNSTFEAVPILAELQPPSSIRQPVARWKHSTQELSAEEKIARLEKEVLSLRNTLRSKNATIKSMQKANRKEERRTQNLLEILRGRFNEDQLNALVRGDGRGTEWSAKTLVNGLKLLFACGAKGYKLVSKLVMTQPSIRSINQHTARFKFRPGPLIEIWDLVPAKTESMLPKHRECVAGGDEMAVRPAVELDRNTMQYIGRCTLPASKPHLTLEQREDLGLRTKEEVRRYQLEVSLRALQEKAHKVFIIELGGCLARWKMLVNYNFTHATVDPEAVKSQFDDTILRGFQSGLKVRAILTDMGMRGMWNEYGIDVGPNSNRNWIPHPCCDTEKLWILPDSTHVYKNIFTMLKNNCKIILHENTVRKFNLPGREVHVEHLLRLAAFQENSRWKLAPKLTKKLFGKEHFSKMAVNTAARVFNRRTAAALRFLVNVLHFDKALLVTAFFIELVAYWFLYMSARNLMFALSKHKLPEYLKARERLQNTIDVFQTMKVGAAGEWKPSQTGVKSVTKGLLDMAEFYLDTLKVSFVCGGHLTTTDFVENEFSVFRMRDKIPTPLQVKISVKRTSLSRFMEPVPKSSYAFDDREHLLNLFPDKKKSTESSGENASRVRPEEVENEDFPDPEDLFHPSASSTSLLTPFATSTTLADWEKYVLYRVAGYILSRLIRERNVAMACNACSTFSMHLEMADHPYSAFLKLTNFTDNALVEPSNTVFQIILEAEQKFIEMERLLPLVSSDLFVFSKQKLAPLMEREWGLPSCHSLAEEILDRFIRMRLRFFSLQPEQAKDSKTPHLSSKTVAGHHLASTIVSMTNSRARK